MSIDFIEESVPQRGPQMWQRFNECCFLLWNFKRLSSEYWRLTENAFWVVYNCTKGFLPKSECVLPKSEVDRMWSNYSSRLTSLFCCSMWLEYEQVCMYCVFILSAISHCTTCRPYLTPQVQPKLSTDWHSPNWKTEAQGWPFIIILEVLYPATGDRTQWQRTTILSGHPSHYVSACTWVWTQVLCVPRQVC